MKLFRGIRNWLLWCGRAFAREWNIALHDQGVMIFFLVLPIIYPIIYTLIYNPEVLRDIDIIVVDQDRTARSRQLVRDASAAPAIRMQPEEVAEVRWASRDEILLMIDSGEFIPYEKSLISSFAHGIAHRMRFAKRCR